LDDDIFDLYTRKGSGAFAAQIDAIASDDAVGPRRHLDHIPCTDLEKENILSKFLSQFFDEIRKDISLFRIKIEIDLIAVNVESGCHRNGIRKTLLEELFEQRENIQSECLLFIEIFFFFSFQKLLECCLPVSSYIMTKEYSDRKFGSSRLIRSFIDDLIAMTKLGK
jgi:hypothetical protein